MESPERPIPRLFSSTSRRKHRRTLARTNPYMLPACVLMRPRWTS